MFIQKSKIGRSPKVNTEQPARTLINWGQDPEISNSSIEEFNKNLDQKSKMGRSPKVKTEQPAMALINCSRDPEIRNSSIEEFNKNIDQNIRPWLDLVDDLRNTGIGLDDVSLPQICVMGDQSSGKSSVLEALSGIEFPRGSGIVTRCATEVKMKRAPEWHGTIKLSGDDSKIELLQSPKDINTRIEKLTEELTQNAKGIEISRSIQVEISSPSVSDLTVIDLPGIVRWKMDGQSETVVADVDGLVQRYLDQPRTVILAVIPSNVDIATVDIIARARRVDPEFRRTIGVFTKPDMMDSGQLKEKIRILKGNEPSIELTCAMVKNRGPDEIEKEISLAEAKTLETDYFNNHANFKGMDPTLFGIDNLSEKLSSILGQIIKAGLPGLENDITEKLVQITAELVQIGEAPPTDNKSRLEIIKGLLKTVFDTIRNASEDGIYTAEVLQKEQKARIYAVFKNLSSKYQEEVLQGMPEWDVSNLKNRMVAMRGRELPGFGNTTTFTVVFREVVDSWRKPVLQLIESTTEAIIEACYLIIGHYTEKHKTLGKDLQKIMEHVVTKQCKEIKSSVQLADLFESEMKPNTVNALFLELQSKEKSKQFEEFLKNSFDNARSEGGKYLLRENIEPFLLEEHNQTFRVGSQSNDEKEAEILKGTLEAYWKTKTPPFIDRAIRTVDLLMLHSLDTAIEKEFYAGCNDDPSFNSYFYEAPQIQQRRKKLHNSIDRLNAAKREFRRMNLLC